LPLEQVLGRLKSIFEAVACLHRGGIVHRDLKPDNVMVLANGDCKVMDFGLVHQANASRLTASGMVLGTPAYMAPEQVSERSVDGRADQYALGVLCYEQLSGRLPFEAGSVIHMMVVRLQADPTPLERGGQTCPLARRRRCTACWPRILTTGFPPWSRHGLQWPVRGRRLARRSTSLGPAAIRFNISTCNLGDAVVLALSVDPH
jgi:serine/threonine protein kinase